MRVIAGSAGGRRLVAPRGRDVRPTADRVREALFSSLAPMLEDATVLDLYAGAGTLGIEALSRGAAHVVFVEDARPALEALRANLDTTGLADRSTVVARSVDRFEHPGPFDLVLADPPYAVGLPHVWSVLARIALAPAATVVVERDRRDPELDAEPPGVLALRRMRTYGDTVLIYLQEDG